MSGSEFNNRAGLGKTDGPSSSQSISPDRIATSPSAPSTSPMSPAQGRFPLRARLGAACRSIFISMKNRPRLAALIVLLGAVSVYAATFGWILNQRYEAFQTYAWDLGAYNQAMYTTLFSHRLFYYTADSSAVGIGSLLGAHFSPILFLLLPFYAAAPNPSGLLVIEAVGLASGTIPLYFLSRRAGLTNAWTLVVEAAYLLSPVLMGIGWYDFHAEALLPVTVLFTVYCYYYAGRWTFVASWLLCLSVIETVSPLLFLFALAGIIALILDRFRGVKRSREVWEKTVIAAAIVPVWLGIVELFGVIVNQAEIGTLGTAYSNSFSVLGPNLGFIAVVPYALLHPSAGFAAIEYNGINKLAYVLVLFGSLAFLPLLGPKRLLLPAAAWLVLVILSNGGALADFGDQYAAYGFSFLVAGAPFGLVRLRARWNARPPAGTPSVSPSMAEGHRSRFRRMIGPSATVSAVVLAIAISSAMVSPLLTDPSWNYTEVAHGIPTVTQHDLVLHQIIDLIPPAAGVLTVSAVFPEVSSRVHAYVVPISSNFRPNLTFDEALDSYVNDSQYVLIDYVVDFFGSSVLVRFANLSGFGILVEEDQIILFERGWNEPPQLWVPAREVWCGSRLGPTDYSYVDRGNVTGCGMALSSTSNPPINASLWNGPYVYGLLPGEYSVMFWVSVDAQLSGRQLEVASLDFPIEIEPSQSGSTSTSHSYGFEFSVVGSRSVLNSSNLTNPGPGSRTITANLTLTFEWANFSIWGVGGFVEANNTETHLFAVTLQQLSP